MMIWVNLQDFNMYLNKYFNIKFTPQFPTEKRGYVPPLGRSNWPTRLDANKEQFRM
jgi:hypothetical protein